jgi:ribonuclease R
MVHVSTMADDYYRFMEGAHVLRGEKSGRVYRLGDRLKVQVIRVDLERRQIDLGVSEILDTVRASDEGRGRRPRTGRTKSGTGRERRGRPGRRERAQRKGGGRRSR